MHPAIFKRSSRHKAHPRKVNTPALLGLGLMGLTPLLFYGALALLVIGD